VKFSSIKSNKWFKILSNIYVVILLLFLVWVLFFDTNSYLIHKELKEDINALQKTKKFYREEIEQDKMFIMKMEDSHQVEKYAREKYFLKKKNEDIYIIEDPDSITHQDNE